MDRRRTLALTAALSALWLAVAWANVARGAAHAGAGYRFWAFQHHCYSDVLALHGDRYLGGGRPLPYLEDRIEYPVLLGLALWAASFAPGGALGHLGATWLLLAACLAVTLVALHHLPGASPWWLGATPALACYALLNWDLLPIALLALALLALERGRHAGAGALAALGVSAKLFPAVLLPAAAGALATRRDRAPLFRFLATGAAFLLLVNLPLALLAPEAWAWFFRFNAARGAENSIWEAFGLAKGPLLDLLSAAPLVAAALFAAAASAIAARRGRGAERAVRLGAALALVVWIATNKVFSPQYALYGFLAGALAAAPFPLFAALSAISIADFYLAFEVRARRWEPAFRDLLVEPGHVVRTVLWLLLAGWIARELVRIVRRAPSPGAPQ